MDRNPGRDEETKLTAAIWWAQLREPHPSEETLARWQEWMAADPHHAQVFEELNALGGILRGAPAPWRQQLIGEFGTRPALRRRGPFALAAAAVAAIVLVGWWVGRDGASRVTPPAVYASAVGENRDIRLPDGSGIQLGAASSLTASFGHGRRDIELGAGEAFFTVSHDRSRPFVVAAGPLRIEDLGTAFNVRRTGQRVSVAVTQGRVRLLPASGTGPATMGASAPLDLVAGQQADFDPETSALTVSQVAAEHAAAWRDNRLEFINEPLSAVIANVNRYSRHPIQLADPRLGELMFTGTVNTTTIDSWIGALPYVFPVQVSTFADHVVLSSAEHR